MRWDKVPFESLYAIPSKNGLTRPARVRGGGYKMINMGELFAHDRIGTIDMELVPMNEKELENMLVEDGDLLFARQSLVLSGAGKCSIVKSVDGETTFESHIIRVRLKKDIAYPNFFFYYFKSPQCGIKSIVTQGVQAGIRGNELKTLPVALPPLDEQIKIADMLTQYDDLIENNSRRIQLLEESARLLYQEWFVHLRFPGHEQVKITDGVPEGWSPSTIGEMSSYLNRGITPKYDDDGEFLVINQKCIRNRVLSLEPARRQSKEYKEEKGLRLGDVLINSTGTGTLGRVAQVWEHMEKVSVDTHVTIVRPADEIPYLWLGYSLLGMEKRFEDMGEGATNQKELKRQHVSDVLILKPPYSLMELFHDTTLENTKQIQNLIKTNKTLAEARDLLLPKLMSGELTV